MNRRSFLASLAAPFLVKSNVGLATTAAPLANLPPWTAAELEAAYQRAWFGSVPTDTVVFVGKDFFNHTQKFYRDYYSMRMEVPAADL